jgi:hypothetical protein
MMMLPLAAVPDPSTRPRFVRNFGDCAICCMLRTGLPAGGGVPGMGTSMALLANVEKGTAAMNCPNVPLVLKVKVRLEA